MPLFAGAVRAGMIGGASLLLRAEGPPVAIKPASPKTKMDFWSIGRARPKLPAGLKNDFRVFSAYGFKIVTITDKTGKQRQVWAAASEADFRKAESIRLKIKPEEVKVSRSLDDGCGSDRSDRVQRRILDPGTGFCTLVYYPEGNYYYCTCT